MCMNWPAVQKGQYKNVRQNMFSTKSEIVSLSWSLLSPNGEDGGGGGGLCCRIDCDSLKWVLETQISNAVEQTLFARS